MLAGSGSVNVSHILLGVVIIKWLTRATFCVTRASASCMTLSEPAFRPEMLNSFSYASPQMTSRYEHKTDSEAPPASLQTCRASLLAIVGINRSCQYCLAAT